MVKRIFLISLLFALNLTVYTEVRADGAYDMGNSLEEHTIALDIGKMRSSIKKAFFGSQHRDLIASDFFYRLHSKGYDAPFSINELYEVCLDATADHSVYAASSSCINFVDIYMNSVKRARKLPPRIVLD